VGLPALHTDSSHAGVVADPAVHLIQGRAPVHAWLAGSEGVQVRAGGARGGRGQPPAPARGAVNSVTPRRRPMPSYGVRFTCVASAERATCVNMPGEHSMAIAATPRLLGDILVEEGLTTADVVA